MKRDVFVMMCWSGAVADGCTTRGIKALMRDRGLCGAWPCVQEVPTFFTVFSYDGAVVLLVVHMPMYQVSVTLF